MFGEKYEAKVTAETVLPYVVAEKHSKILNMLKKKESMRPVRLEKFNVQSHLLDLISGTIHIKFIPYCAGPKSR